MNFDKFKDKWSSQKEDNLIIIGDLDKLKSTQEMINKFVADVRKGIIMRLISLFFILIFPLITTNLINGISFVFYCFFFLNQIVTSFAMCIRYRHLKNATKKLNDNTTYNSLLRTYYEFKYYLESNVLITVFDTPSGIGLLFILLSSGKAEENVNNLLDAMNTNTNSILFLMTVILIVLGLLFTIYIVYYLYSKYTLKKLNNIKSLLDELDN